MRSEEFCLEFFFEMSIVLHEDKTYYQDAAAIYKGAETMFQDEDTQPIEVPIIAPKRVINFDLVEEQPELSFTYEYLGEAMNHPAFIRNLVVLGPLHSGKTSFMDILVRQVRDTRAQNEKDGRVKMSKDELKLAGNKVSDSPWDNFRQTKPNAILSRYTDTRLDERERGVSLKSMPVSYILPDSRGKSHLLNVIDTPGHVNFRDEADVGARMSDGVVIVIDAVMGGTECLRRQIQHLVSIQRFDPSHMILVISQMDRLVLELRLPPSDAYFKLRFMIDELNGWISEITGHKSRVFRPELGNVLFASGKFKFVFSLPSFARTMYIDPVRAGGSPYLLISGFPTASIPEEADVLAKCLWGDIYCDRSGGGSFSKNPNEEGKRSFIQFVLEPFYKILSACVSEDKNALSQIGVWLPNSVWETNAETVITAVMEQMFPEGVAPFIDAVTEFIPNAKEGSQAKVRRTYTGSLLSEAGKGMLSCSSEAVLMVHCAKSMHVPDCTDFVVLGRVFSGTIRVGSKIKVLPESYSFRTGETVSQTTTVEALYIPGGRYWVPTESVPAGNWVLIGGVSETKSCTLTDDFFEPNANEPEEEEDKNAIEIFKPLDFSNSALMKIACEPLHPSDLPRMVEALRKVARAYPQLVVKVEETGEHILMGTGELYLDCVLHDVRKLYGGDMLLEIRLSDPVVVFNETILEASQFQCSAASPNKLNAISFIAEPLNGLEISSLSSIPPHPEDPQLYLSREEFYLSSKFKKERQTFLTEKCEWDVLAARNLWAFGPDWEHGSNVLLNDTLPDQVSKEELRSIRDAVVQGFQWATREGPLVEEPIRNCKLKLLDVVLNSSEIARGQGQLVPAVCRSVYASVLTASPRLMEPVCMVEMDVYSDAVQAVMTVLSKRRGHIVKDTPKPATPFTTILAYIPLMDSFGFETDLRLHTRGLGFGLSWFDHWAVVPGDPLDAQVEIRPLESVPKQYLARDFLLKTRRRKGLSEEVLVQKYIDDVVSMGLSRGIEEGHEMEDY